LGTFFVTLSPGEPEGMIFFQEFGCRKKTPGKIHAIK
jgi:hypothetical protein